MFLHVSVILSTGDTPPWADTPQADPPGQTPLPGQTPPVHAEIHPPPSVCWDTVNKRAVRIPLECILVIICYL